jgi:hypothetical protein
VLVKKIKRLASTTPAPLFFEASPYRARALRRHPSSAEEGSSPSNLAASADCSVCVFGAQSLQFKSRIPLSKNFTFVPVRMKTICMR